MKARSKAAVVSFVAAGLMAATPIVAALATTVNAGGGVWQYGANSTTNYSNYNHNGLAHRSSVANPEWGLVRSATEPTNQWAFAAETVDAGGGNNAYWDTV